MDLVYSATFLAAPILLKALAGPDRRTTRKKPGRQLENTLLPSLGAGILAQGLLSDHEVGAVKALNMPAHLTMDLGLGAFMIAAPWLLNLDPRLRVPMVALGVAGIGLALMTDTKPSYRKPAYTTEDPHNFLETITHKD
jgi:hypothetical protein